jgi:hypothetical protein
MINPEISVADLFVTLKNSKQPVVYDWNYYCDRRQGACFRLHLYSKVGTNHTYTDSNARFRFCYFEHQQAVTKVFFIDWFLKHSTCKVPVLDCILIVKGTNHTYTDSNARFRFCYFEHQQAVTKVLFFGWFLKYSSFNLFFHKSFLLFSMVGIKFIHIQRKLTIPIL